MSGLKLVEKETTVDKWAAISGKWKFTKNGAHYLGPTPSQPAPVGLARGSERFRDGLICSKVKLSKNAATAGGFFVRFFSPDSPYAIAQIGGWDRAYAIGEYQPGFGWVARASAGALSNLNISEPHEIKVAVVGQSIKLTVDEVEVLNTTFSIPLEGTGFGLYAYDDAPVEFTETKIVGNPPKIFVIMPFAEPFDTHFTEK